MLNPPAVRVEYESGNRAGGNLSADGYGPKKQQQTHLFNLIDASVSSTNAACEQASPFAYLIAISPAAHPRRTNVFPLRWLTRSLALPARSRSAHAM